MNGFAEYDHYDALGLAELIRKQEIIPEELCEEAIGSRRLRCNDCGCLVACGASESHTVLPRMVVLNR